MALTSDLSDQFFSDLLDLCDRIQVQPLDLLGVMMNESGVKANARNAISNASGLIQFLPSTLQSLGWNDTPDNFRRLAAEDQLPYVEAFFQPYVHYVLDSAARVYQVVFLPSSLKLGSSFDTVIAQNGGLNSAIYNRNRGLDANFDGKITVGELQQAIERHYTSPRWQEIVARLNNAGGSQPDPNADPNANPPVDLRTQSGVFDALEALGFDRDHYTFTSAVRAFQLRNGLSADGIVGPRTRASLVSALDEIGIPHIP